MGEQRGGWAGARLRRPVGRGAAPLTVVRRRLGAGRLVAVLGVLVAALLIAACIPPTTPERTGTIHVTVTGLPEGTPARITITGPNGYLKDLDGPATLADLTAGRYQVTVAPVDVGELRYLGDTEDLDADVASNATTEVSVEYPTVVEAGTRVVQARDMAAAAVTDTAVEFPSPPSGGALESGDLLLLEDPVSGLVQEVRRVVAVEGSGPITVTTEPADITDAIVRASLQAEPGEVTAPEEMTGPDEPAAPAARAANANSEANWLSKDGRAELQCSDEKSLPVTTSQYGSFTPTLYTHWDRTIGGSPTVSANIDASFRYSVTVGASAVSDCVGSYELVRDRPLTSKEFPLPVPGLNTALSVVPMISVDLDLAAHRETSGSLTFSFGGFAWGKIRYEDHHVDWSKADTGFVPRVDAEVDYDENGFVELKVTPQVTLAIMPNKRWRPVLDVSVGPYVSLGAGARWEWNFEPDRLGPWGTAYAVADLALGIEYHADVWPFEGIEGETAREFPLAKSLVWASAPEITDPELPAQMTAGVPFGRRLQAIGGALGPCRPTATNADCDYVWSIDPADTVPEWVSISEDGLLSIDPPPDAVTPGPVAFTVRVRDTAKGSWSDPIPSAESRSICRSTSSPASLRRARRRRAIRCPATRWCRAARTSTSQPAAACTRPDPTARSSVSHRRTRRPSSVSWGCTPHRTAASTPSSMPAPTASSCATRRAARCCAAWTWRPTAPRWTSTTGARHGPRIRPRSSPA